MSYPWKYDEPVDDGNPLAGLHAGLWALGTYIVLLVVVLPREHAHTNAFVSGELLVPPVVVWLLTWVVAHNNKKQLGWWVYALVVPAAIVAFTVFTHAGELTNRAQGKAADGGTRVDQGPLLPELTVPESQGRWTRLDTPEVHEAEQYLAAHMDELGEDLDSAVLGYYSHDSPELKVIYQGINGTIDGNASLQSSLRNMMAGATVDQYDTFNPGSAKGVLGCGDLVKEGQTLIECVWVGNERAVMLTWIGSGLDHEAAAELTVEFRELAATG